MKPTLMIAALTLMLAASPTFAKSELETLRSLCAEQERQIRQLELENSRLRSDEPPVSLILAPKPKVDPPSEPKSNSQPAAATYVVKAGDSVEKIARKVGTTPAKLAQSNGIKTSAMIHPGQRLKIPGTVSTPRPAVTAAATPAAPPAGKTHTIRQGETFFSISKKYRVSTTALIAANPHLKASALRPGQIVNLKGEGAPSTLISTPVSQPKAPVPVEKPRATAEEPAIVEPTPVVESTPLVESPPSVAVADDKPHSIIIEGETTYGAFAAKHGTDAARLNSLNGLDLNNATIIAKGSELYVPARP